MFEKEADKYGIENYEPCMYDDVKGWETDIKAREQSFKDGAEYGYNLAKEEMDYLNQHWGNGKDKANEWHDLRKNPNDLPNNKRSVWCYYGDGYGKGFYDKDDGGWWIEGHIYCSIIDAWCELPIFNKE